MVGQCQKQLSKSFCDEQQQTLEQEQERGQENGMEPEQSLSKNTESVLMVVSRADAPRKRKARARTSAK